MFTADQKKSGILASVFLAQFILESGYGKTIQAELNNTLKGILWVSFLMLTGFFIFLFQTVLNSPLPRLSGRRCLFIEEERRLKREHKDMVRCANYLLLRSGYSLSWDAPDNIGCGTNR